MLTIIDHHENCLNWKFYREHSPAYPNHSLWICVILEFLKNLYHILKIFVGKSCSEVLEYHIWKTNFLSPIPCSMKNYVCSARWHMIFVLCKGEPMCCRMHTLCVIRKCITYNYI